VAAAPAYEATGTAAALSANKADPNLLAMIARGDYGTGHANAPAAVHAAATHAANNSKATQALDTLHAQQQMAPAVNAQKAQTEATGRATVAHIAAEIAPELATIKRQLREQAVQTAATAEHRQIQQRDQRHDSLLAELRAISAQLRGVNTKANRLLHQAQQTGRRY
jgi:hypothetical protein